MLATWQAIKFHYVEKRNAARTSGHDTKRNVSGATGISITGLADNLGVARRTISLLVNEHSGVSAEMALRLSKAFETTPELWLNMQQRYDLWNAGRKITLGKIKHLIPHKKITPGKVGG